MIDVYIGISAVGTLGQHRWVSQVCRYQFEEKITDGVAQSPVHMRFLKSFH